MDPSATITELLEAGGDSSDLAAKLFPLVYDELRGLARQMMAKLPPNQTLQPTALVHEAFLRLVAIENPDWRSRRHFFRTASRAMRFILVDQARRKSSAKHGSRPGDQDPEQIAIGPGLAPAEMLALHEALERLEEKDARKAQLVELRYFGGLSEREVAAVLELSRATVAREWRYARFWLHGQISGAKED